MAEHRDKSKEQQKNEFAEKVWLSYFNQTLYTQGIITEFERNKLQNLINSRKPSPPQQSKF